MSNRIIRRWWLTSLITIALVACALEGKTIPSTPYVAQLTDTFAARSAVIGTPFPTPTPVQLPISESTASRISQLACYEGGYYDAIWSPSGDQIALKTSCGLAIHDANTLKQVRRFEFYATANIVYSPDGKMLLTSKNNIVELRDAISGKLIREFRGHTDNVNTIAFSADGKIVASGGNDSTLRLWNASTGQAISSFASQHGAITDISFSSDGSMIAAGSSTNAFVSIWQTRTGQPVNSFERPPHYLVGLAFRPNSESILISTAPLAWILDAKSGTLVQSFILGSRCCRHVAFSPNGQTVAFSNQLWDVENRKLTRELDTNLTSLSFNTDGTKMVTVHSSQPSFVAGKGWISPPSEVKIWDATTGQMLNKIQGGNLDKILDLAFNANNKNILIAEGDSLIIRDSRTGAILQKLDRRVTTVAFSPDGRTFVTGNQDGTMQTWDAVTYDLQNTLNGHTGSISRITFSHDGRLLMSTSKDGTARVWDAKNWRTLQIITGNSFSLSPEGDMVAVARDGIYFIEAETGVPIRKFSDNKTKTLSFLYNSQSILADGIVYDVSTGSPLYRGFSTFPGLEVVFRMNSRFGIQDLGVWNSIIGSILGGARCDCAPSRMRGMAISPDARWIISGHYDSSIRIWGVKP